MTGEIVELEPTDELARCIIYSRFFNGDVHADELLWRFENSAGDKTYHESAVLRRFAKSDEDVHSAGCGIATKQNIRNDNPPPGPKRRYYCGFRNGKYVEFPTEGDGYTLTYTHDPEDDIYAHVDVCLAIAVEGKSARATRRTDAGLALAECFSPARPHICPCDRNDDQHPLIRFGPGCLNLSDGDLNETIKLLLTELKSG